MDPLPGLIGHGGLYGALAEAAIVLVTLAGVGVVWWRERRRRLRRGSRPAEMRDL